MMTSGRNLIVLSDGTGNSASKLSKTNVWRLYQAISLTDGSQVAVFGDGVGTSSVKVLRVLGLALGVGVKRNVLNLYKFLCRNYNADDNAEDRIWAFGFSRGAFTVRVLAGLIHPEGLVSFASEAELNRNALAAYRAYRRSVRHGNPLGGGRPNLRDHLISVWNALTGARSYADVKERDRRVETGRHPNLFHRRVGYRGGLWTARRRADPRRRQVDLAHEVPRRFPASHSAARPARPQSGRRAANLPSRAVERGRGAATLARRTAPAGRLQQVWFAGAHADVGGGYPDDGLSFVPLCWMIEEAPKGLRFEPAVVASITPWRRPPAACTTRARAPARSGGTSRATPSCSWARHVPPCARQRDHADGLRQRRLRPHLAAADHRRAAAGRTADRVRKGGGGTSAAHVDAALALPGQTAATCKTASGFSTRPWRW